MLGLDWVFVIVGEVLISVGVFCDVMAAIGLHRLPNFYCRLHSLTLGAIGGAVLPLIGIAILSLGCDFLGMYRFYIVGGSIVTAVMILVVAPIGSHAIARAAYRSGVEKPWPVVIDMLALRKGATTEGKVEAGGESKA